MKLACQLDHNGIFLGMVECQPSPLEPGKYLIPGGAVDCEKPNPPEGHYAQWASGEWKFIQYKRSE